MINPLPAAFVPPPSVPLDSLSAGESAVVSHVEASDDDMRRLMTLGICTGRRVELVQCGNPMIVRIFGSRLGVSRRLASRVMVQQCRHPPIAEPS